MSYQVSVLSYQRPELLAKRTLPLLLDGGVPADRITVFIGGDRTGYRVPAGVSIEPAPVGMYRASNAVTDHYDEGTELVHLDDDLKYLVRLSEDGTKRERVEDVDDLFLRAFAFIALERTTLWGLNPVANPYFMRPEWSSKLWFVDGTIWGAINTKKIRSTMTAKEDYERTLQHYGRRGAVSRLRDHSFVSEPLRTTPGGIQGETEERRRWEVDAVASLKARWPGLVHDKAPRDGYPEIALRVPRGSK
ncbi:glycosyltransferase [Arthrobacter phage Klevey]|uniref:Glycosyltransferase n=1 Tax=Arthrobacter phage Klevey TaxID=2867481 RepID=A0AAE8XLH4_9CAUD|nr:glycosyltransferase [Arthrobacter phage Klevey]